jgi:hypothetical protein
MRDTISIDSSDYWVKVVEFLQQNWALIEDHDSGVRVWFIHDLSGVFDYLEFDDRTAAELALRRNGFRRFDDAFADHSSLRPPLPPFQQAEHPNGKIYSSGRYWH